MNDLPAPLTPADCDLQAFPFMPLHVARLRDSDLAAIEDPEACWYAVLLWCASWHQIPAASLPDDDAILTRLSGLGRDTKTFKRHRAAALRGFILCADGRLYHPVVAEQAMEAWEGRVSFQTNRSAAAERQARWREEQREMCARLRAVGITPPEKASKATLQALLDQHEKPDGGVTNGNARNADNVTGGVTPVTPVTPKKGTGTGTGILPPTPATPKPDKFAGQPDQVRRILEVGRFIAVPNDVHLLWEWLALGDMELERDIVPVVEKAADAEMATKGRAPFTFKFFDSRIRQKHAEDEAAIAAMRRGRRLIEEQDARQAAEREASAR